MPISQADHQRVAAAIHAAESGTSGEIVCVLARYSAGYGETPAVAAAVLALALPWALVAWTQWSVVHILLAQVLGFAILWGLFSLPAVSLRLVPRAVQRAGAHRAAMEQFMIRGVSRTSERTGILIFVSLAERYARIVADDGIAAKIPQAEWQAIVDGLVAKAREDRVADGFVAAIAACGQALKAHFPASSSDSNQLPDRLYVV